VRVSDRAHIQDAIRDALASNMPALVDVVTSKEAQSPSGNHDKTRRCDAAGDYRDQRRY
jgi:thiamine pyrophosphate-dependent acetolactate synthase large subunit-like protein